MWLKLLSNPLINHRPVPLMPLLLLYALLMSACGAFEIGIEHVPPDSRGEGINWQATAEALQTVAVRPGEQAQAASPLLAAQPAPTLVPTPLPLAADRAAVAYVQGGDIWVMSLPDWTRFLQRGEAIRLTHDGNNLRPAWSASGRWLSFVKNPDEPRLWVVRQDGSSAAPLFNMAHPNAAAWSPVEDKLAIGVDGRLHVYDLANGMEPHLFIVIDNSIPTSDAPSEDACIGEVKWSADGQRIAFTRWSARSGPAGASNENDGLWIMDIAAGEPQQILTSEVPQKGEFILLGWSGDGDYLLYAQAPVLSASMLADGVPLYQVPVAGGTPKLVAESVIPHAGSVQSQPQGLPQVAIVEGSGREMWQNKRLRAITVEGDNSWDLSLADQAVSSPAWSPDGSTLAYIGTPETEGVTGGKEARNALMQRQLWLREEGTEEPRLVGSFAPHRIESPMWLNNQALLVVGMDFFDKSYLMYVDRSGSPTQVLGELSPAPEWFGFYGHVDWRNYVAVWRPAIVAEPAVEVQPIVVPPTPQPLPPVNGPLLLTFLQTLRPDMTLAESLALYGEPDSSGGSGLIINQYQIGGGIWLLLAFPGDGPLSYAHLQTFTGQRFNMTLVDIAPGRAEAPIEATPTATPIGAATAMPPTATPLPASLNEATPVPHASMTPTPAPALEVTATATPLPVTVEAPTVVP